MPEPQGRQTAVEDCRGASRVLPAPWAREADHQEPPAAQLQLEFPLHWLQHIHAVEDAFNRTKSARVHSVVVEAVNAEHGPWSGYGESERNARFRPIGRVQPL